MIELITEGVTLDERDHTYRLNGDIVPGCTTIIRNAGCKNLDGINAQVLKEKSEFGTKVHEYCQWFDEDELDPADLDPYPRYQARLNGWIQFRADWEFVPHTMEKSVIIRVNGMTFGATPDRYGVGKFGPDGEICDVALDIKTTAEIEPSHALQTAAYALPLKTEAMPFPKRYVIQLLPEAVNGKLYRIHEFTERMDEKIFLCCLAIETWKRNNKIIK